MAKNKRMDQIKDILSTYASCRSVKETARRLRVSRNTVRRYLRQAEQAGLAPLEGRGLDEGSISPLVLAKATGGGAEGREAHLRGEAGRLLQELKGVGVTRHLLWSGYIAERPEGYGYSQFCEILRQEASRRDLTLSLEHEPGAEMQVDFAGKKLHWIDAEAGEPVACEVLVAVLPYSQYCYAAALPSQQAADFVEGLNQALLYMGGLPKAILSDNLKSYVTRADRFEPDFNALCAQLSAHYQIGLQAARVRKPKDKASVENMVSNIYRGIYAILRGQAFYSLRELNQAIAQELERLNAKPFQKRPGSRRSCFEAEERHLLRPLPSGLFEIKRTARAKVQRNYHVFLGGEKNFYSVPYQHAGKRAEIVYTSKSVEVFIGGQRAAVHSRLPRGGSYRYQTMEGHMPKNHSEWRQAQGYDGAYFIAEAQKIGPAAEWAVQQILLSRICEPQAYLSCRGVLSLAAKYTPQRLERACGRCRDAGKATYTMLKNILSRNLDREGSPPPPAPLDHENIRGPESYQ
jgi:transposase